MPPKAAAGGDGAGRKQPTAQEAYMFYTVIKNMKGKPEVDWNAVAADNGFKNAETAKVRYGQIKRKLGMDTWAANNARARDDDAGDDAGTAIPATPTAGRGKKVAAAPSTPAVSTGAGVKKRSSASAKRAVNSSGRGRGRKAKPQLKEEDEGDDDVVGFDNSIGPKNGNGSGSLIKTEPNSNTNSHLAPEFIDFPVHLAPEVLERRAILVKYGGAWTVTPVMPEIHAQWLARLPAQLQSQFYIQVEHRAQCMNNGEESDVAANIHMSLGATAQMGYMPRDAAAGSSGNNKDDNNGYQQEHIDLNSIPMHSAYFEQMQREQELRDQQELFGNSGSAFDAWN
ncbi:hypothetical protein MMYC01_201382 [Madurella mycetomatis]|uniref:Myb-like DNA-binding domain-containing protein n=1 Tax=Madurella mycetomatis TaxID=100816 RepID=A0A175WCL2_9PEZI|nr:hypothetical protein MMYC01_201382 [Madurella mycetomatis]